MTEPARARDPFGMPEVVLFDVMGTLLYDPFFREVPEFLGIALEELLAVKHPTAWVDFELGEIDDETLARRFFADGRRLDVDGLRRVMHNAYAFLPGIEELLAELRARDVPMHVLSNYPHWYRNIEDALGLARYLPWSFVSCATGVRKPDARAYLGAAAALGVTPEACLLVDDRRQNCEAAQAVGMDAIRFCDVTGLRAGLAERGFLAVAVR